MNYVVDALKKKEAENNLPVIRLEIDYELMTLFDAIEAKDDAQIQLSKMKLEDLRKQFQDASC